MTLKYRLREEASFASCEKARGAGEYEHPGGRGFWEVSRASGPGTAPKGLCLNLALLSPGSSGQSLSL